MAQVKPTLTPTAPPIRKSSYYREPVSAHQLKATVVTTTLTRMALRTTTTVRVEVPTLQLKVAQEVRSARTGSQGREESILQRSAANM